MFTHHGTRTHTQNLRIASLLSFVAGAVNVVGFVAIGRLTTNVTGHFAFFMGDVRDQQWDDALIFFVFIFAFFGGAFVSNTLIELSHRYRHFNSYLLPVLLEFFLLGSVALAGAQLQSWQPDSIAMLLLFAMGLQNAMVTKISKAVVRTTHLTGLFTDLGIEMSQWFFHKKTEEHARLRPIIQLRMLIISCFFAGGIVGGLLYSSFSFASLWLPNGMLLLGMAYDHRKFVRRAR